MGTLQAFNAQRVISDSGLLHSPDSVANLEQTPTVHELGNATMGMGEYGGLDFLFAEHPLSTVATPLESVPSPGISSELLARIQGSGELTNTYAYQPRSDQVPGGPVYNTAAQDQLVAPAQAQAGSWTFTDTLKKEVAKVQDYIRNVAGRGSNG